MTSCMENIQMPTCVWFEGGQKRNALVSMLAGTLFFIGWWFIIDAHAKYPNEMANAYHVCGVFGTISLFMVNSVTNAQIRGDAYNGGCLGARGARGWLFVGFVMGFAAVIAACWILFADFVAAGEQHHWPGVGLFLQNVFIFLGSLTYKFGRSEEYWDCSTNSYKENDERIASCMKSNLISRYVIVVRSLLSSALILFAALNLTDN